MRLTVRYFRRTDRNCSKTSSIRVSRLYPNKRDSIVRSQNRYGYFFFSTNDRRSISTRASEIKKNSVCLLQNRCTFIHFFFFNHNIRTSFCRSRLRFWFTPGYYFFFSPKSRPRTRTVPTRTFAVSTSWTCGSVVNPTERKTNGRRHGRYVSLF